MLEPSGAREDRREGAAAAAVETLALEGVGVCFGAGAAV